MLSKKFLLELELYVKTTLSLTELTFYSFSKVESVSEAYLNKESLDLSDFVKKNKQPTFTELLFQYIDESGQSDSDVYKKAGLDRRLFSKIRSNAQYRPSKHTAIALALALCLSEDDVAKLIGAAGYILSDSDTADLVIKYCIEHGVYDIHDVNLALNYFSIKPIAGTIE